MGSKMYLTDDEVARVFRMSTVTFQRIARGFVRGGEYRKTHARVRRDISAAEPETVGGFRLWRVDKLAKTLEMTKEQVIEASKP